MNNFPAELIYVLVFAAIVLAQYLLKQLTARVQYGPAAPDETAETDETLEARVKELTAVSAGPSASAGPSGRSEVSNALSAPARRRFHRASILGNKRDAQNAMAVAAIVGPCRASEPYAMN